MATTRGVIERAHNRDLRPRVKHLLPSDGLARRYMLRPSHRRRASRDGRGRRSRGVADAGWFAPRAHSRSELALGLLEPLSRSNESRRNNKETPMKKTEKNQKKLTLHKLPSPR
jgi:hypothetical protein